VSIQYLCLKRGVLQHHVEPDEDWLEFPSRYLKANPHAAVYRKRHTGGKYLRYAYDRAKRHPRQMRSTVMERHELPPEVQAAMLLLDIK